MLGGLGSESHSACLEVGNLTTFVVVISGFCLSLKQLLYETCLCIWLLSYYDPAVEYLATSRTLPRLIEVVKGSTKEKVSSFVSSSKINLYHPNSKDSYKKVISLIVLLLITILTLLNHSFQIFLYRLLSIEQHFENLFILTIGEQCILCT